MVVLVDRVDRCDARYKAARKKRGRKPGTPPKPCVDLVFGGPRIDTGPWSLNTALAWARACETFVEGRVGKECVALAVLHTDEGAFHTHILVSCSVEGMPLGSDATRSALAAGYAENVRLRGRHRRECRAIVDGYQAEVGYRWGFIDPARAVNARPRRIDVGLAQRLRIQDQLIIAEINLARAGEVQDLTPPTTRRPIQCRNCRNHRSVGEAGRQTGASLGKTKTSAWSTMPTDPSPDILRKSGPGGTRNFGRTRKSRLMKRESMRSSPPSRTPAIRSQASVPKRTPSGTCGQGRSNGRLAEACRPGRDCKAGKAEL